MTTALDKLRGMVSAARRDSLIATAEADILDRLARVAEDEDDERLDGALEELADNLRKALDKCVDRDNDADDDLPTTGCPTCDAVLDTLAECHGMSLCGPTAADVAESARDWIGDLLVERDEARAEVDDVRAMLDAETRQHEETSRELDTAHAEVERLRAEVASLRERIDDADEWEPPAGWLVRIEHRDGTRYAVWHRDGFTVTHKTECPTIYMCDTPGDIGPAVDTLRGAVEWCEAQMVSAPTVGATDAGPDAPALIVEGDDGTGAREARAVPAAPVSGAEQSCGETGVDRPRKNVDRACADMIRALGWTPVIQNNYDEESFAMCATCGELRTPWRHDAMQVARDVLLLVAGGPGDEIERMRAIRARMDDDALAADAMRGPDGCAEARKLRHDLRSARCDVATLRVLLRDLSLLLTGNIPPLTAQDIVPRVQAVIDERSDMRDDFQHFRQRLTVLLTGDHDKAARDEKTLLNIVDTMMTERRFAMTELANMAGRVVAPDDITNLIAAVEAVRDEMSYRSEPDTPIYVFDSNGYRLCVGDVVLLSAHPDDEPGSPGGDDPWTVDGVFHASGKVLLACGSWRAVRDAGTCTLATVTEEAADGEG